MVCVRLFVYYVGVVGGCLCCEMGSVRNLRGCGIWNGGGIMWKVVE